MTDEEQRNEALTVYRLIFETWRFQVDSGWQRSNYFAAFETALLLGIGKIITDRHFALGAAASIFGIVLTRIWLLNDRKVQTYIDYWWGAVQGIEKDHFASEPRPPVKLSQWDFAWKYKENACCKYRHDDRHTCGSYRSIMRAVPWLFTVAWIFLLAWSVVCLIWIGCSGRLPTVF